MNCKTRCFLAVAVLAALWSSGCREVNGVCPRDIRWVRASVEYRMLCHQTYRSAWEYVKSRSPSIGRDWAVVLDVDMTVLDNSDFQESLYRDKQLFPHGWSEYMKQAASPPIPGAAAFVDNVRSLGERAHIVYITDRGVMFEGPTRENLRRAGLWEEGDVLICRQDRKDRPDTKAVRREEVMLGTGRCEGMGERVIVALIGDQIKDVTDIPSGLPLESLVEYFSEPGNRGENGFILPNPIYGDWLGGYR